MAPGTEPGGGVPSSTFPVTESLGTTSTRSLGVVVSSESTWSPVVVPGAAPQVSLLRVREETQRSLPVPL